jgi:hypothetical protein
MGGFGIFGVNYLALTKVYIFVLIFSHSNHCSIFYIEMEKRNKVMIYLGGKPLSKGPKLSVFRFRM